MQREDQLISLMRELYNISSFRVTLHDTDFREIASYPAKASSFCRWIQQNPDVLASCRECDAHAFQKVQKTRELYTYHCHCGLYEAVAPLYDFGVLSGYLMMGQMLDDKPGSRSGVEKRASSYVEDQGKLRQLIAEIPTTTEEKVVSHIHIMSICAEYITLTNRMNLRSVNLADEVRKYIGQHYAEKISIEMLTRHFFTSKSTLLSAFKKRFGKTINRCITETRLTHAARMLQHTDMTIHEIAEACGFSDQNYFSKVFYKEYKMTPSSYRQKELD